VSEYNNLHQVLYNVGTVILFCGRLGREKYLPTREKHMPAYDLSVIRHSAAHLLGHAVLELFPDTLLTIGPATQEGFFYDFLPARPFKAEDLVLITQRMREIVARNLPLEHREIAKAEARELYKNNPFKLELIEGIPGEYVGLAVQGNFYDLCRGGHAARTGELGNFVLQNISGSYWRADKKNAALQRISGTAFATAQELEAYEKRQAELAQYDHRTLGRQLDLFSFHSEGPGFPFFHPKGCVIINTMKDYMRELHRLHSYQEIITPTMLSDALWQQSGHYAHYRDNMYFSEIDDQSYAIKPMNCPGAILTYKSRPRSYRELPLKLAEFGHVHRHELSGVLHGLLRVRAFTQDDAHIFCTPEMLEQEVISIVAIINRVAERFRFSKPTFFVATRPENSMGDTALWETATLALKGALDRLGISYEIEEGEGAFYGPKISAYLQDAHGRRWQCGTVQIDFFNSENFDLTYVAASGQRVRPVIIHQAVYGSLERFLAVMLEHYRGNFPFWLAPTQVALLPLTDEQLGEAARWHKLLSAEGVRAIIDQSADPLKGKIKTASEQKIPWMLIIGKREAAEQSVTLRLHNGEQFPGLKGDELIIRLKSELS
jgi:threonyl-tRNA synthetase